MKPVFDVLGLYKKGSKDILEAIERVLNSGRYILGEEVKSFEKEFAQATENKYCVGVASGTEAITLVLGALGIGQSNEVIAPNFTAYPTIVGIERSEAKAIVVDVKENALIDEKEIEKAITKNTRAIVPVHLFNRYCNMTAILRIAKKHKLKVIEDCAQRTFTKVRGDCGAFSFYPTKTLGAYGDAGAVCTNSKEIYEKLLCLRDYGQTSKNVFKYQGLNSRMDELQAAILRVKLKKKLFLPQPQYEHSSDRVLRQMSLKIFSQQESLVHYPYVICEQEAFKGRKVGKCPVSKKLSETILTLPPKRLAN
jgi:dTDP-4-amino-4,6-dideoxygalactose transaminase